MAYPKGHPVNITDIEKAIASGKPEVTLNDGANGRGTGSLLLVVRKSQKTAAVSARWFGCWSADGRTRKVALGAYPTVNLKAARKEYEAKVRDVLQAGGDPRAAAEPKAGATLGNLLQAYIDHLRDLGKSSAPEIERAVLTGKRSAAVMLGRDRDVASITSSDISMMLGKIFDRGKRSMADHMRAYLSAAFAWAVKSKHSYTTKSRVDWGLSTNPVAVIPPDMGARRERTRNLSPDELRQLWHALDAGAFYYETEAAIRLMICCGQRVLETIRMERGEVDLRRMTWTMPKHKTKMKKRDHVVPLPPQAVRALRKLMSINKGEQLFSLHPNSIHRPLRDWCKANNVEPFTPRDLRRTWKSRAGDGAGIDKFTRDLIQQHAKSDVSGKHYDHADYLPVMRKAMAAWARWMRRTFRG
jgi:integrase